MALAPAIACGAVAAVLVPLLAAGHEDWAGGLLTETPLRLPLGGGLTVFWSWTVFCVVTLLAWALFAAARQK